MLKCWVFHQAAATMSKKVMLTAKQALINLIPQRPGGHLTIRCTRPLKKHLYNSQSHCQTDNDRFAVWSCPKKLPKQNIHTVFLVPLGIGDYQHIFQTNNTFSEESFILLWKLPSDMWYSNTNLHLTLSLHGKEIKVPMESVPTVLPSHETTISSFISPYPYEKD